MRPTNIMTCLSIFLLFFCSSIFYAQDFQTWQKKQQEEQKKQQEEFDKFKKDELRKFQEFKDKRDSAFVEFLKKEWQGIQLLQGLVPDKTPKPIDIPVTKPEAIPPEMLPEPSKAIKEIQTPLPPVEQKAESIENLLAKFRKEGEPLSFDFFAAPIKVNYAKAIKEAAIENPINETHIGNFWAELSRSKYGALLAQAKTLREQMRLNDWGYFLLLNQIGGELYKADTNRVNLFVWFMLAKSGYEAKVGYDENRVYLLLPSANIIYGAPYFIMAEKKYYLVTLNGAKQKAASVYTYEGSYPKAENLVALNIKTSPLIRQATEEKQLKFSYQDKEYALSLKVKRDAVDFYDHYPQTDYSVYFGAPLSPEAQYSLVQGLKPIIAGKSEVEAANILLHFVQTAFAYKNDETQFGKEKPFFPEETLFYNYSDCEDRSVLFAYLVRNLLGLEVIGLNYPNHVATAVRFSTHVAGESVEYGGEKYIICDATYVNANLGQSIPRLRNVSPKIIAIAYK